MRACLWWIWNQGPKKMFGYNSSAIKPSVNTGNRGLPARHTNLHASVLTLTLYHTRPPTNTSVCLQEASSYKCPRSKSSLSFNSSLNSQGRSPSRISNTVCDVQLCTGHKNGGKKEIWSRPLITVACGCCGQLIDHFWSYEYNVCQNIVNSSHSLQLS